MLPDAPGPRGKKTQTSRDGTSWEIQAGTKPLTGTRQTQRRACTKTRQVPACSLCCALCRARASQAQQLRAPAAHLSWYPASHTPELPHVVCLSRTQWCLCNAQHDSLAEWSKALASGASPQGRGLEPHSCQPAQRRDRCLHARCAAPFAERVLHKHSSCVHRRLIFPGTQPATPLSCRM